MFCVVRVAAVLLSALTLCSCSQGTGLPETICYISGTVYVDGEPASNLSVTCHEVTARAKKPSSDASTLTDGEGTFTFSSFANGDGVPEGDYTLTFFWGTMNLKAMKYEGPDRLNGRYDDASSSEIRITVSDGTPVELGRIDLTTK
jgi:hypothetical protein